MGLKGSLAALEGLMGTIMSVTHSAGMFLCTGKSKDGEEENNERSFETNQNASK